MGTRLLAILLLAGCATTVNLPPAPVPVCVPADLPPVATWTLHEAESILVATEDHRIVPAVSAHYTAPGGYQIKAIWLDGLLAFVDPAPHDKYGVMYFDAELMVVADRMVAKASPRWQSCAWQPHRLSERT